MPLRSLSEAYAVLEIHASATETEVKSAYKRLALKSHPDKNPDDPHATVKFQQVTEAYQMVMGRLKSTSSERGGAFRFSGEAGSDSEEYGYEEEGFDANIFSDADLARAMSNFIFAGGEGAFAFTFMRASATCDCPDCVEERNLQRQREQYRADQATRKPGPPPTSSPPSNPAVSPARPPGFDPHAHWLSDDEDLQKWTRSSQKTFSTKQGKKKKVKQKVKKSPAANKQAEPDAGSSSNEDQDCESEYPHSASTDIEDPFTSRSQDTLDEQHAAPRASAATMQTQPAAGPTATTPSTPVRNPPAPVPNKPAQSTQSNGRAPGSAQTASSAATTPSARTRNSADTVPSAPSTGPSGERIGGNRSVGNSSSAATGGHQGKHSAAAESPRQSPQSSRYPASKTVRQQNVNAKSATGANASPSPATTMPRLEGVQLCRTFLTKHGNCRYGDACRFSHGSAPGGSQASSSEAERDSDGPGEHMGKSVPLPTSPVFSTGSKHSAGPGQVRTRQAPVSVAEVIASVKGSLRTAPSPATATAKQKVPAPKKAASAPAPQMMSTYKQQQQQQQQQQRVCDFYGTARGCRYGDKCKFAHFDA